VKKSQVDHFDQFLERGGGGVVKPGKGSMGNIF